VRLEADAGPGSARVLGDRTHLQRAIANVLSDAVKFTSRSGAVTVDCRVDEGSGRAVLTCRETGIGIPEADLDQLFTRFYRASNATTLAIPGTGLGLAIVQQIVEEHHGELRLTSREGQGTTVEIDLPLAPAEGEALRT
jgi:signal transduction histidine kinase